MSRKIFIAGSTGAVGRTLLALPETEGADIIAHQRPKAGRSGAAVFALDDEPALRKALADVTTVVQLIGTMRKRFGAGDTYESSDIATTAALVAAAQGTSVDHFVLLSSVGAGRPVGAYLKAKQKAERIVTDSGIPFTIFRPSAFVGGGHAPPAIFGAITRGLGLDRYRPIRIEALAQAIFWVAQERQAVGDILEGATLWSVVQESIARPPQ